MQSADDAKTARALLSTPLSTLKAEERLGPEESEWRREEREGELVGCGIKLCYLNSSTPESLTNDTRSPVFNSGQFDALREMYKKIFGFFYTLIEYVCPSQHSEELGNIEQELGTEDEAFVEDAPDTSKMYEVLLDKRSPRSLTQAALESQFSAEINMVISLFSARNDKLAAMPTSSFLT
ncbi:hypothetical protein M422DRAFT_261777 [Sphaerobolus stellatus SS14]|uniref:Uncharacterized protein n=1 Tax=Sphaerobolus stellatus (strain SS14) TaxID=990650 RepID=A0A0C9VE35_SPHS4|nr:hypothetical protein M422DRAFT_269871 [Sphaerobolus stellatus SS14]KIJ35825.1 hypothetical protein M422DRAFT_261777 [Sphaerobolus stellatus SS14]